MRLGEMIRELRQARGVLQRELASRLGVKPSVISSIETGARLHVGEKMIRRVSEALDLSQHETQKLLDARRSTPDSRSLISIPDSAGPAEIQTIQLLASCVGHMPTPEFLLLGQYLAQWRRVHCRDAA